MRKFTSFSPHYFREYVLDQIRDEGADIGENKNYLHGTTIFAFRVDSGQSIVIASDSKVSEGAGLYPASNDYKKLMEIDRTTVVAMAGAVGVAVSETRAFRALVDNLETLREEPLSVTAKVHIFSRIIRANLGLALSSGMSANFIMASYSPEKEISRIYYFLADGSWVEKKEIYYAISGSGRVNEGTLLNEWRDDLTIEEGIELAKKVVKGAAKIDCGTGGKIRIKIVNKSGILSVDGGIV